MNSSALIVRGIASLLSLAGLALFARRLGPDGYAGFALATAIAAIFLSPLPRSVNATIDRMPPGTDARDPSATVARVLAASIVALTLIAVAIHVMDGRGIIIGACALAAAQSIVDLAYRHASSRAAFVRAAATRAAAAARCIVGALLMPPQSPAAAIAVVSASAAIAALLIGAPAWRDALRGHFAASHVLVMRELAPPVALTMFAGALLQRVDRLFLADHVSAADLGTYAAAVDLSLLCFAGLSSLLYVAWLPRLMSARAAPQERASAEGRYALAIIALLLPALTGLILLRVELIVLLFGEVYATQAALLPWIALAVTIGALRASVLDAGLYLEGRTGAVLRNVAVAAFVNVILNAVYAPQYGVPAAVGAALISQSLAFVLAWRSSYDTIAWRIPRVQFERILFCWGSMVLVLLLTSNADTFILGVRVSSAAFVYAGALYLVNGAGFRDWVKQRVRPVMD